MMMSELKVTVTDLRAYEIQKSSAKVGCELTANKGLPVEVLCFPCHPKSVVYVFRTVLGRALFTAMRLFPLLFKYLKLTSTHQNRP